MQHFQLIYNQPKYLLCNMDGREFDAHNVPIHTILGNLVKSVNLSTLEKFSNISQNNLLTNFRELTYICIQIKSGFLVILQSSRVLQASTDCMNCLNVLIRI